MSKKKLSFGVKAQMVIWALFMPVCLIVAIWAFLPDANKDDDMQTYANVTEGQEARTEPVGHLNMPDAKPVATEEVAKAEEAPVAALSPKETYDGICAACHATGLLDSPKFGDKVAWDKRIADAGGFDGLVKSAIAGKGSMPPKGGASVDDAAFAEVVKYLAGQE